MIGLTARIRNGAAAREWARRLPGEFQRRASTLVAVHALNIERNAKRMAPVDKNALKPSIHTVLEMTPTQTRARVGTDVKHGIYQEFGTGLYGYKHQTYVILPKKPGGVLAWASPVAMRIGRGGQLGRRLYRRTVNRLVTTPSNPMARLGGYQGKVRRYDAVAQRLNPNGTLGKALYRSTRTTLTPNAGLADKTNFATKVIHPGVHPQPFLGPAFALELPPFRSDLRRLARLNFPS